MKTINVDRKSAIRAVERLQKKVEQLSVQTLILREYRRRYLSLTRAYEKISKPLIHPTKIFKIKSEEQQ